MLDKSVCNLTGQPTADLICPGHPLLEATIDLIRERNADVLKRGTIFVDESDDSDQARLLFYIEDCIQDGVVLQDGTKRVISKQVHFVELFADGTARHAGYAPYLDYRAATEPEQAAIHAYVGTQDWLASGVEERARGYAISNIIPQHFAQVREHKQKMVDKITKAVKERLTAEIQYWDFRAADLKQKEAAGKINARLNSQMAARRAEDLAARLQKRLSELDNERMISPAPPVITGGALIIPNGLLAKLMGGAYSLNSFGGADKKAVELAAMKAVMDIERQLGYQPHDVSAEKVGYDIESSIPEELRTGTNTLRFIEVKGRNKGATTVTVSKNEILTGLNKPEEFILAVVEVDGASTHAVYLKHPFRNAPDFTATSVNYDLMDLIRNAEIVFQK